MQMVSIKSLPMMKLKLIEVLMEETTMMMMMTTTMIARYDTRVFVVLGAAEREIG